MNAFGDAFTALGIMSVNIWALVLNNLRRPLGALRSVAPPVFLFLNR